MRAWIAGIALGVIGLAAVRFAFFPPVPPTHYHANWAIFVEGERVDLSDDRYMEDVAACAATDAGILPTQRVHMHDNNHDVVHVHHQGATWGHLMRNLGLGLGDDYLVLDEGRRYFGEGESELKFIINGFAVPSVDNRLIRSGDRLLISYGPGSVEEVLRTQFPDVASNAEEYNQRYDPAGCAGAGPPGLLDRIRHAFVG